jgi:hypothetical protein
VKGGEREGKREGIAEGRKKRGEETSAKERVMYSKERQRENKRAR